MNDPENGIKKYLKHWTEHELVQRGRRASGVEKYRLTAEMFLRWLKNNNRSSDPEIISRSDIDEFMKWLFYEQKNISNASRANKLAAIRSLFRFLIYKGVIKGDPTAGIPSPKVVKKLPVKFTTEELRYIFSMPDLTSEMGMRDLALLLTIYGAGLRVSEACSLKMDNVIDAGGYIRLTVFGKGGKYRIITLRTNPARLLRQWLTIRMSQGASEDDQVFVRLKGGNLEGLSAVTVNNILKKYAKRVGIQSPDAFIHKLRATFATDLYDSGRDRCRHCGRAIETVDLLEIMYLLGHSDPKTTMRYIAISEKVMNKTAIPDRRWRVLLSGPKEGVDGQEV